MFKLILKLTTEFVGNNAKDRISKSVLQENKSRQIFRKTPSGGKKCLFFGFSENLACFLFLKHTFRDSPFGVITDELSKTFSGNQWMLYIFFPFCNLHAQISKSSYLLESLIICYSKLRECREIQNLHICCEKTATVTATASSTSSSFQIG